MSIHRLSLVAALALCWSLPTFAQHWSYSGEVGPENWSKLDSKFAMRALGRNQSPIDLSDFVEADLEPLELTRQ